MFLSVSQVPEKAREDLLQFFIERIRLLPLNLKLNFLLRLILRKTPEIPTNFNEVRFSLNSRSTITFLSDFQGNSGQFVQGNDRRMEIGSEIFRTAFPGRKCRFLSIEFRAGKIRRRFGRIGKGVRRDVRRNS